MKNTWKFMRVALIALVLVGFVGGGIAMAAGKPQTTCPVMGGEITSKDYYADYEGKRVYFCCPACKPMFEKDPQKYMKKLEEMGQTPEAVPEKKQ